MNATKDLRKVALMVLSALMVSGCIVVSINPWLDLKKAVPVPSLAGAWIDTNNSQTASFVFVPQKKHYALAMTNIAAKTTWQYQCTLHSMGDELLLQVGANEEANQSPGALLPVYMLFRVELAADAMKLYPFARKGFEDRAKTNRLILAEIPDKTGDREPVIVGSLTTNLEKFVSDSIKDKTLFAGEPAYSFVRVQSNTTAAVETKSVE